MGEDMREPKYKVGDKVECYSSVPPHAWRPGEVKEVRETETRGILIGYHYLVDFGGTYQDAYEDELRPQNPISKVVTWKDLPPLTTLTPEEELVAYAALEQVLSGRDLYKELLERPSYKKVREDLVTKLRETVLLRLNCIREGAPK